MSSNVKVHTEEPKGFSPDAIKGSCFLQLGNNRRPKILLFLRDRIKGAGGQWCTPLRKVGVGENVRRPLLAKVAGILRCKEKGVKLKLITTVYPESSAGRFEHQLFRVKLPYMPAIEVGSLPDYTDFVWVSPRQALSYNLADELADCIKEVFKLP